MEYFQTIWNFIHQNWLTILIGLLGFLMSIYLYFKGKRSRIPTYNIRTINLVQENINKIETVEILYSKKKIKNLSVSKIAFWNNGRETITSDDVASKNTVRLVIEENYIFLDANIIYRKNQANDFDIKISDDNKSIDISFEYFDFGEGIVIQVFHTGNHSANIYMKGSIRTVNKIHRKGNSHLSSLFQNFVVRMIMGKNNIYERKFPAYFIFVTGIVYLFLGLDWWVIKSRDNMEALLLSLAGATYIFLGYIMVWRKIPKGFDIFNEEF
ncbi:MAG: hypothetical protein LBE36_14025 [Flavobacteriaceae bacterium]|jgi:hypothetical protein|nr:hypothetical protein [Flavobacteriaceae bacterium]